MDILTLSEVSNIVEKVTKFSNPSELAIKGLHFGRLYFKAGDYKNAVDWIIKYLRKFDRDFQAHRLLGECYEKLSKCDAALASYKQSLQIKPNQYDLVVHVATLFLNPGQSQNPTKAQVWLDKAAVALPGDPTVFKMKMELLVAQQASSKTLEDALLKELKIRRNDASLHEQYVSFMKTEGRLIEAFRYCRKISNFINTDDFESNYKWLSCEVGIYKDFIDASANNDPVEMCINYCLLLEALSQLIWLCIKENKQHKVFLKFAIMDQYLASLIDRNVSGGWQLVIDEIVGQFSWIAGTLLLYQAQLNNILWKDACGLAVFFYSYSISKPLLSMSSAWAVSCCKSLPKFPLRLYKSSAIRLSQSHHMVLILNEKLGDDIMDSSAAASIGRTAHHHLCSSSSDESLSFVLSLQMTHSIRHVPVQYMSQYDELAALSRDVHGMVWLGLRWLELEDGSDFLPWSVRTFPSLKLHMAPNTSSSVLSLNLLDIESFIVGCVFTAKKKLEDWNEANVADPTSLPYSSIPPALCRRLTTVLQDKWWKAASELSSKSSRISASEASKLKPILQRGLECIRGYGNHGLDTVLVAKFAKYFASKAFSLLDGDNVATAWYTYQRKAVAYWTLITPELGRLSEGVVTHRSVKDALFPSVFNEPSPKDAKAFLSEAYMCRGELAAREKNTDDAVSFYGKASIPQASYCQAHVYRKLLENLDEKESLEPQVDLNRKKEMLMKKYRHCLEVTLTRLQQQPDESLHEKTIRLLSSPHVSPTRPLVNKSANESVLCRSKQSTPKANDAAGSSSAPLIENEAVNNLVDTITTLTSALSSLQLEMECLREENRLVRQSSPAQVYHTPQNTRVGQGFSPALFHPESMQRPLQPLTPQHPLPPQSQLLGYGNEGIASTPAVAQYPDAYQQQAQSYYSPSTAPFVSNNYGFPPFADNGALLNGGYGVTGYPNLSTAEVHSHQPHSSDSTVAQSAQSTNWLATALQSKDKEALQQKFGSMISDMRTPPSSVKVDPSYLPRSGEGSSAVNNASVPTTASNFATQSITPQNVATKTPVLQQLLGSNASVSTTPVSTKEIKPNLKVNLQSQATPVSKPHEVHFLEHFISPKSPGTNMKFQSPEQMDRENQELDALEQADANTSTNPDAGPHFEPIIPLPDLVEVKTGEEDEDALFSERCKLFRWHTDQWKERGIGLMKLLKHKSNGSSRLVMRREQVLKVCCNHYIADSIRLSRMPSCERAMVWIACDFAEDQAKTEKFAAKFKTVEIAEQFRDLVNGEATGTEKSKTSEKPAEKSIAAAAAKFKFEMAPPSVTERMPKADEAETSKPSPFSSLASVLSGASFAGSGPNGGIKLPLTKFSFGAPKPKSKQGGSDDGATASRDNEDIPAQEDAVQEEEEDGGPHHQPIIDLPDLVEVKTGEEDEEMVFSHRAKLFRYVAVEWKERGVGDLKILKHQQTGKYRLVMRREQVLKLCANHHIGSGMKLSPQGRSENAWVWMALDFSESQTEPQQEMFAVKFRTVDEAREFHQKFMEGVAIAECRKPVTSSVPPASPSQAANAFMRKELRATKTNEASSRCNETRQHPKQISRDEPAPGEPTSVSSSSIGRNCTDPSKGEVGSVSTKPTGFNLPPKPVGSWTCPGCYASNTAENDKCPCCNCVNPNASNQPSKSGAATGFNLPPKPVGSWTCSGCYASNTAGNDKCLCCEGVNPNASNQPSKSGFNLPPKPVGSWTCPGCYASNTAENDKCPCCESVNPNASNQPSKSDSEPKEEKFIMQFGTNISSSVNQSSPFSFGIKQSSDEKSAEAAKQHPTLQRAGGSKPVATGFSQYQFGFSSNTQPSSGFSSSPAFGDFQNSGKPETQQKEEIGFPYDEDYYDETDTTETSETYSESEDHEKEDPSIHQSPMSRFSAPQESAPTTIQPEKIQDAGKEATDSTSDVTSANAPSTAKSGQFTFGSSSGATFSELAASNNGAGSFSFASSAGKFANAWKPETLPMFSNLQPTSKDEPNQSAEQDQDEAEEGDGIYVKPIVQLPKVVVETGEENETTLFSKRSKLFRFAPESSQWKERGIGEIMIKHNTTTDRFRILMRREQVLKVCANHYITADIKLEPTYGSNQAWTWLAADYADNEEKIERLSIKFKTPEIANQFKDQFEECQVLLQKRRGEEEENAKSDASVSALINNAEKMKSELGFFKDKLSVKSNINLEQSQDEDDASSSVKFDPSIQLTPLVKQHEMNKERQKESKDTKADENTETKKTTTAKTSLQLDHFEFKITSDPHKAKEEASASGARKQERNISICSAASEESQDIAFEPIIPLPAKVIVPTGEENEQIIFEERSKLYIFDRDGKQWKERGIGKIKLLQDLHAFKMRLVMRREQVLKVCLNQLINDETHFDYKENSAEKIVVWTGTDFSDTEKVNGEILQFAIRFKTCEVASEFLRCINDGIVAHEEKRLLEPALIQDQSIILEQVADTTEETSEDQIQSPVRSPVKPAKPLFSFANVASPLAKENNQFEGFVFGDTPKSSTANQKPFSFSANAAAFSLGATSTPLGLTTSAQPAQNPTTSDANGSMFGAPASTSGMFSFSAPPKFALSSETFQPTQIQKPDAVCTNQSEPVKLCIPDVEQDLAEIQSSAKQEPAVTHPEEVEEVSSDSYSEDAESSSSSSESDSEEEDDDDDVIFVSEVVPTGEQIEKAEKLLLPRTFYLYENLPSEEWDSEEEDKILAYIERRNRPDLDQYDEEEEESSDQEEEQEEESSDQEEEQEEESRDESSLLYQTASQENDAPDSSLTDHLSSLGRPQLESSTAEPQQLENIFQSFANMSDFSFAAMAAESGTNKHAFGSRRDDAFQVSEEKKILFLNQSEEEHDPDNHDPQHKPLLSELPPLVQVKTGEEDENVCFKERCKLFKFDNSTNSWKERGLGNIKILFHREFKTFRVVMRREQVLKICANHRILKEMSLMSNGEKAFVYVAQDQSEEDGEAKLEKFFVRFKTPEIAEQFKTAWEQARSESN